MSLTTLLYINWHQKRRGGGMAALAERAFLHMETVELWW